MNFEYTYERLFDESYGWLISNPTRIDIEGHQIKLQDSIRSNFPTNKFSMFCENNQVKFYFENELSESDQSIMADLITTYQEIQ